MNTLDVLAQLGPVHQRTPCVFSATCPACGRRGALSVRLTVAGYLPRCRDCHVVAVVSALKALAGERPGRADDPGEAA